MTSQLDWWTRNRDTGRSALFQAPNPAILVFFGSYVLRWFTGDNLDHKLVFVGMGALIAWALDELIRGSAPVRKVLGLVVLSWEIVHLFF